MKLKPILVRFAFAWIAAIGVILLQSCEEELKPGTLQNQSIPSELAEEINTLDQQVILALKDGSTDALSSILSTELATSPSLGEFVEGAQRHIESKEFEVVDRFYRTDIQTESSVAVFSGTDQDDDYIVRYTSPSLESAVSILKPKREGDDYLLTAVYGLQEETWKLLVVQFDRYTLSGLNAVQLYREAKAEYDRGHLVNAFGRMLLSRSISSPAGDYFEFRLQSEMDAFNQSLSAEAQAKYPMPLTIPEVASEPVIFQIIPQRVDDQICTMIKYTSEINIKDTLALAAENKALHEHCRTMFKGIDSEVPFIFYRAFNEMPTQDLSTPYFGFVRPVDERFM